MTLLIALIANALHLKLTGAEFASSFTIFLFWLAHLAYHSK
jgi:hypothetical protein